MRGLLPASDVIPRPGQTRPRHNQPRSSPVGWPTHWAPCVVSLAPAVRSGPSAKNNVPWPGPFSRWERAVLCRTVPLVGCGCLPQSHLQPRGSCLLALLVVESQCASSGSSSGAVWLSQGTATVCRAGLVLPKQPGTQNAVGSLTSHSQSFRPAAHGERSMDESKSTAGGTVPGARHDFELPFDAPLSVHRRNESLLHGARPS